MSSAPDSSAPRVFRLPRSAYLIVLLLLFGTVPLAFASNGVVVGSGASGEAPGGGAGVLGPRMLLLLIPIAAAFFIARTSTLVDAEGIRVRALFGSRRLPWAAVRGLSVEDRSIYAVCTVGTVRLPCVRVADLASLSLASGGHLPEIARPVVKPAPTRRR